MSRRQPEFLAGGGTMGELVRAHDWAGTPLGPAGRWPAPLRTAVSLLLGARQPVYIAWGPDCISIYNDGYIPILGSKHPEALGKPYDEVWAEVLDEFRPIVEATMAGEAQHFVNRPIALGGRPGIPMGWFTFSYTPLRDEAGKVAGFYCAATETTDQVQTEATLHESQARLALAVESGGIGHWELDIATREFRTSALCRKNFGRSPDAPFGYADLVAAIHPDDRERQARTVATAIEARSGFQIEYRLFTPDGALRWAEIRGRFEETDTGGRLAGVSLDITDHKRVEEALRESEHRQAFLLKLSDALRPLGDPVAIQEEATRLLGAHLGVSRALYAEFRVEDGREYVVIERDYHAANAASGVGRHPVEAFGPAIPELRAGRTIAVSDTESELAEEARAGWRALGVRAYVGLPLIKNRRLVAGFGVHNASPRDWTTEEIALVQDTAERTWAAVERARAEAALRDSEARYRALIGASNQVLYRHSADWSEMLQLAGGGFLADTHGPDPDWFDAYIHPDDQPHVWAAIQEAIRTKSTFELEHRVIREDGTLGWTSSRSIPVLDEDGEIKEWFGAATDVTERREAEEALRESKERLAAELAATRRLQEISGDLIREQDTGALYGRLLDAATAIMGSDAASMQEIGPGTNHLKLIAWKGFHPESARFWQRVTVDSATTCGVAHANGVRVIAADTHAADFMGGTQDLREYDRSGLRAMQSTPLVSRAGMPLGMMSTHWRRPHRPSERDLNLFDVLARQAADLIERARAEATLRESEERLRHVIDSAKEYAIVALDAEGRITMWNSGAERLLGYHEDEILGRSGNIFFTPEDRARGEEQREMRLAREEGRAENERWHLRKDGSRFWGSGVMLPIRSELDRGYLKIFRDGTEARLADERQQLLIDELNHRVKNTLATVQAIAFQTLRGNGVEESIRESFELRLRGLAASHDMLTQERWAGADLAHVVASALEPFRTGGEGRLRIDGPTLYFAPKPALAFGMVLHELATNAAKYGALSNGTGGVDISWAVDDGPDPHLHFRWVESGGPPVSEPTRKGFGSRLIERSLVGELDAEARIEFARDGVVCTVVAPISTLVPGEELDRARPQRIRERSDGH